MRTMLIIGGLLSVLMNSGQAAAQVVRSDLAADAFAQDMSKPLHFASEKFRCGVYWHYWSKAYSIGLISPETEAALPEGLREPESATMREEWLTYLRTDYGLSKEDVLNGPETKNERTLALADFDYFFRGDEFSTKLIFRTLGQCRAPD